MTLTLPEFVARWQASTLKESAGAKLHFVDLCEVLGQPHPAAADQGGTFYTFEKGATKVAGGQGFADVWYRGHFAWEYKGKHKNTDSAYQQLLQYREDLENPPLLVVCDLDQFHIHTNFTGTAKHIYSFNLADLESGNPLPNSTFTPLAVLRALFEGPERLRPQQTTAQVTEAAAAEFAKLADSLRLRGADPERAAHFLMRLLFCLFAEDIGLLPEGVFTQLVDKTRSRPADFNIRLRQLFSAMATGGSFGYEDIAYFNGGLFSNDDALDLTTDDLSILTRASKLDWGSVEPAIFGTLFERSLDPSKRSQLGAHYTSREDILLIIEPVLMQPLRSKWEQIRTKASGLADGVHNAGIRAASERTPNATRSLNALQSELRKLLLDFQDDVAGLRVLDPACGSGNFLYVALRRLLDLEKEVSVFAATHGLAGLLPKVNPAQLYGIELNVYAHELASVVVWIGYIQWLHDNGFGYPSNPILKSLHNIVHMDAILAYDEHGKPVEPDWPNADVIVGNPPFLGGKKLRSELGDKYVNDLFAVYDERVPREADLVTYWFEKSRSLLILERTKRVGLLATQGIRGGANRKVLARIKDTGDIFWAWSDRNWVLDGATVHVSMVGFDKGIEKVRILDGVHTSSINSDLTANLDLTQARRLQENQGIVFMGTTKVGAFDIDPEQASLMLNASINPNRRTNADVVKPWINGKDITSRSRGMWIIDFGADMTEDAAALYEMPYEYVRQVVKPERDKNNRTSYRQLWWLHGEPRPALRSKLSLLARYIATVGVSKHRLFIWVSTNVIPDHAVFAFARDDDYFLGVLHSKPHELWARRTGTQLREAESGFRYTPTTTFETFPFPFPPGKESMDNPQVQAISKAASELVEKRDFWLNPPGILEEELKKRTLTNLYNARPTWLDMAHSKLDRAVLDAYGWPYDLSDEQILTRLLALNVERAANQQIAKLPVGAEE